MLPTSEINPILLVSLENSINKRNKILRFQTILLRVYKSELVKHNICNRCKCILDSS